MDESLEATHPPLLFNEDYGPTQLLPIIMCYILTYLYYIKPTTEATVKHNMEITWLT